MARALELCDHRQHLRPPGHEQQAGVRQHDCELSGNWVTGRKDESRASLNDLKKIIQGGPTPQKVVPVAGLEPARIAPRDFESRAFANFATPAYFSKVGAKNS